MAEKKIHDSILSLAEGILDELIMRIPFRKISSELELCGSYLRYHLSYNDTHVYDYETRDDEKALRFYNGFRKLSCSLLEVVAKKYPLIDIGPITALASASKLARDENDANLSFSISVNDLDGKVYFDYSYRQYSNTYENETNMSWHAFAYDNVPLKEVSDALANTLSEYCTIKLQVKLASC